MVGIFFHANRNPEVWGPDFYEWKPERWLTYPSPPHESVSDAHVYWHLFQSCEFNSYHQKTCHGLAYKSDPLLSGSRACR